MKKSGSCPGPDILRARLFFREVTSSLYFFASTPEEKTEKAYARTYVLGAVVRGRTPGRQSV